MLSVPLLGEVIALQYLEGPSIDLYVISYDEISRSEIFVIVVRILIFSLLEEFTIRNT